MPPKAHDRPNIIFFFTDQQRWDTCGCYDGASAAMGVTPNLDRMAAEGVRFEHAFTCQPVCGPARACLQTGKYATEVGCFKNNIALPLDETTIAHRLSGAGYEVGYIGKWHLASDAEHNYRTVAVPPERRGGYSDYWLAADVLEFTSHGYDGFLFDGEMNRVDFTGYRVDRVTDFVLEYLRTRTGERPFFLFLSYIEPHHQNDRDCYEGPDGSKERFADFTPPRDLADSPAQGDWRENYPDYLGCVHSLDAGLGRIRDLLAELGIADDTLILYTSDHGSHFRTRNAEYKRSCHEACIRVPMVARGPGFLGGKVVDHLVSLIDVPPTILAAGGAATPAAMRGRPLQTLADGGSADWPDDVFLQISEDHIGRAIRTRRWKYSVWVPSDDKWSGGRQPGSDAYVEQCLYDLDADPHELNNLVTDPRLADVRRELRGRLVERMAEAGEAPPRIDPAP
jgi:arylsulfatase A-like enzyme